MGVALLQTFPIPEGKSGPQTIELLTKRICALGAVQNGSFAVDCETYTSSPGIIGPTRYVNILHNSEQPASVFAILKSETKTVCLIADNLFDVLMTKMHTLYSSKKATRIESRGPRFEVAEGDFLVKLGTVTMGQNFKGILVDVEYQPCVIPSNCWELLKEFVESFLGSCVGQNPPSYLQNRMNEVYHPRDTMCQYLDQFTAFRKLTTAR